VSLRDRRILVEGLGFPEGPRWHEERLWLSDIAKRQVIAVSLDGQVEVICEVAGSPSGLGWLPDGRMLVVSMHDRVVLRLENAALVLHANLNHLVRADLNDMVVDGAGRAYVSNFGYDPASEEISATGILLVRPDGSAEMLADGLFRPNGMAITADGETLVVAETRVHRLTAFDIGADGSVGRPWTFADLGSGSWADGICMDERSGVWVGDPRKSRCVRVVKGVGITDEIQTEVPAVACALGGPARRTLFLAEAPVRPMEEGARDPQGRVESFEVDVPGAGWP
jgi:sugar lactone lactonase YvrE